MTLNEAEMVIEGLIFASSDPLSIREISSITQLEPAVVEGIVEKVRVRYMGRGFVLRCVGGAYQFVTNDEISPWIEKLGRPVVVTPLSHASLETLAIIAYRQPITRSEIEQIRGVRSDSAVNNLLERELVQEMGRKDGPGRPILYGVTKLFFAHFGLESLDELPPLQVVGKE